jgi:hypothetical protein
MTLHPSTRAASRRMKKAPSTLLFFPAQLSMLQMAIQLGVEPAIGDQLLMAAVFGNAAAIKNQHPIRLLNRTQAVGDDQGGAPAQELI